MWEIIASLLGLVGAVILFIIKRTLSNFEKHLEKIEVKCEKIEIECKQIPTLEQRIEAHKERLDSITRDHSHLEDLLDKISDNLAESNTTNAGVKESVNGLRDLLQNLIAGNLLIQSKQK